MGAGKKIEDYMEEKQPIFTAVAAAYTDGMETGARVVKEMEGAAA